MDNRDEVVGGTPPEDVPDGGQSTGTPAAGASLRWRRVHVGAKRAFYGL